MTDLERYQVTFEEAIDEVIKAIDDLGNLSDECREAIQPFTEEAQSHARKLVHEMRRSCRLSTQRGTLQNRLQYAQSMERMEAHSEAFQRVISQVKRILEAAPG
jgi:uncharacterized coiled-coil DUF342 family protein